MNQQKQYRNDKLQKSSLLFLQLGLVLALFLVYTALEFESIKKEFPLAEVVFDEPLFTIAPDIIFSIEKKAQKSPKKTPQSVSTEIFTKIPDKESTIEEILKPIDPAIEPTIGTQIDKLPDGDTDIEYISNDIDFKILEDAPIFPGCEGLEKKASKTCFTKEISKFVNQQFNTDITETLNIRGKQRIWVEFKIDKTGAVTNIKARSPYKRLETEAIRVVEKLPQMTPGKQRMKPVNVKYVLPIIFQVQ